MYHDVLLFVFYGQVLQNLIEMGFDEKDALEALRNLLIC